MKRICMLFLLSVSFLLLFSCSEKEEEITPNTIKNHMDNYIDSLINDTKDYVPSWNKESFKGRWNYIDGVFLNSILEYSNIKNDNKYKDFVKNYVNYYINSDGNFLYISDKNNYNPTIEGAFKQYELDSYCESRILFDLYDYYGNNRYLNAINNSYYYLCEMPMCENNINYCHKSDYPNQIWLDGFYMYVPFLAKYAKYKNNNTIFDNIISQYEYVYNNQRNEENGLYYHGLDVSKSIFWADGNTGLSKSFWSRSLGWLLMSLVDSIEYFPENKQTFLISMLSQAVDSVYQYMDLDTKMYYQLTDKGNQSYNVSYIYLSKLNDKYNGDAIISNYLESSGSSMFAYTMMKAARLNYVDEKYSNIGKETFEGIYKHSFNYKKNELNDICITAGLGPENKPYRDGTPEYYLAEKVGSNDAKGVGPFITAYIEYLQCEI